MSTSSAQFHYEEGRLRPLIQCRSLNFFTRKGARTIAACLHSLVQHRLLKLCFERFAEEGEEILDSSKEVRFAEEIQCFEIFPSGWNIFHLGPCLGSPCWFPVLFPSAHSMAFNVFLGESALNSLEKNVPLPQPETSFESGVSNSCKIKPHKTAQSSHLTSHKNKKHKHAKIEKLGYPRVKYDWNHLERPLILNMFLLATMK